MNTFNTLKKMLWTAIIAGLSVTGAFAQQVANDVFPKGQFLESSVSGKSYQKSQVIYSADASKLVADFSSNDFSLQTVNGVASYGTGIYSPNADLQAVSLTINVPNTSTDKIFLEIVQSLETESRYDFVSVWIKADGKDSEVYKRSGKATAETAHINLTAYAGKQIEITLRLNADGSEQGSGWQIHNLELFKGSKTPTNARAAKSSLMLRAPRANSSLEILAVNTEAFPDAIFVEFTVKDANGNFIDNLTENDLTTFDDYSPRMGCKKMMKVSETMQQEVDIVFLVDNSGSMYDDIVKVNNAIDNLLTGLQGKCDARVGLLRYGEYPSCPNYAEKAINSQGKFFYSLETEKNQFLSEIWSQNHGNGWGYEPYYEVMNWAANQNFVYRTGAKKVFILIGDEIVNDGLNNIQCDNNTASTLTAAGVANTLKLQGIQAFFICDIPYSNGEYDEIASETGGLIEDISALTYDDILNEFAQAMVDKYILRYCLGIDSTTIDPTVPRTIEITYNLDPAATDTETYLPISSPSIVRTAATQLLDNTSQPDNVAVQIGATVIQNGNTLDYIDFYYKQHYSGSFQTVRKYLNQGIISGDNVTFTFDVPAGTVLTPLVEYYFEATTTFDTGNGTINKTVSSPPYNQNFFAWTFAVLPNLPPAITNVAINPQVAKPCVPIEICATVIDNTQNLAIQSPVVLHYRTTGTPSMYIPVEMEQSAPNSNVYCATIPADAVQSTDIEYYIVAKDNYGTLGFYGDISNPKIIQTNSQAPSNTGTPFYVVVGNYSSVVTECDAMTSSDILEAYFTNDCGELQLAASTQWNGVNGNFTFTVYGDSDANDGYKDGFINGETIYLKLIRGGIDYGMTTNSLVYSSSMPVGNLTSAAGPGVSAISITGNGTDVNHNSTTPSTLNNTNFGASSSPVTKYFRIYNTGCERLYISRITLSDNANFSVSLPNNTLIEPGFYEQFPIDYLGLANANATVSVYTNAVTKNPYVFDITGATSIPDPCVGIILVPNPSPNFITPTLIVPVANNNTFVYAAIYSPSGTLLQTLMTNNSANAGTYYLPINITGYVQGVYPIVVYRNNDVCNSIKLMIQ